MQKYQRVATSAFIYKDGKALIAQRAVDELFLANHWENVGGSLEWGEHPTDGLLREVLEESGLHVKKSFGLIMCIITSMRIREYKL